ncbi:MAG: hypothetical protein BroJett024_39710 [Alphaproteobacteria bacterium]|nr:MAG: hypothetical protein BroJett024_39710 [Alphaproteobacteria bacterium]
MTGPITIGPFRCHRLEVGGERVVEAAEFFNGCEPASVAAAVGQFHAGGGTQLLIARNCSLFEVAGMAILVDPAGEIDKPGGGPLRLALAAIGLRPQDIDVVLITHVHEDRVAGMADAGKPAFPRARHLIHHRELAFLHQSRTRQPDGRYSRLHVQAVAPAQEAGLLERVTGGHVVHAVGGAAIVIEDAPGHTPGHYAVRIAFGQQAALYASDTFHHPLQMLDPAVATKGDLDPTRALATRVAMAAACARDGTIVIGSHFPGSGAGRLTGPEGKRKFVPVGA